MVSFIRTSSITPWANSYAGGMDIYVRQFGDLHEHDQFYVSDKIKAAFMNYTTQIVTRYTKSPSVLGWYVPFIF